jgi:hypothetical protein
LADAKPRQVAISARVGGKPLSCIADVIKARISAWRGVNLGKSSNSAVFMSML